MSPLGLALGGGGARGLAHIGVLKVLEENNIYIEAISGCSMGSVIGGLYAYYKSAAKVEEIIIDKVENTDLKKLGIDTFDKNGNNSSGLLEELTDYVISRYLLLKTINRLSFFEEELTEKLFEFIPDVKIESLSIKFSAIATDLISGKEINFVKGSLRDAVKASSAIPGIFPPVKMDEYLLVDGAASESVPAGKVKEIGADRVLAVNVTRSLHQLNPPENFIELLFRTEDITSYHLSKLRLEKADLVIQPDVEHLEWSEFKNPEDIIKAGETAAREKLSEIKKLINRNSYLLEIEQYIKKLST